jgi:hypothetical protein
MDDAVADAASGGAVRVVDALVAVVLFMVGGGIYLLFR